MDDSSDDSMDEILNGSLSRLIESMNSHTYFSYDSRPYTEQGKKMTKIVKTIASESKKCGYNPKKDTNWCDLPMEMRAECVKWMDFETRIHMRSTEIERSFVDAHKYHFEKMKIKTDGSWIRAIRNYRPQTTISMELTNRDPLSRGGIEKVKLDGMDISYGVVGALKNCDFGEIECFSFGNYPYSTYFLEKCAPFRFKSLKSKGGNLYMVDFLLGHSEGDVEKILLNVRSEKCFSVGQFLRFLSFFRAKLVVVEFMTPNNFITDLKKMADKWSEDDVEIGTKCYFTTGNLETPIHGTHQKTAFIRMNNESKVIEITASINTRTRQGDLVACVIRKPAAIRADAQGTR